MRKRDALWGGGGGGGEVHDVPHHGHCLNLHPGAPGQSSRLEAKKMGKIKEKKKIQGPVPSYYFIKAACFLSDVVVLIII